MAKKKGGKGKKKDKKGGTAASGSAEPELHFGEGKFEFPNGDLYEGGFCAHRFGICWRQGHGIYTTKDGQVYEGEWNDDKLVENREMNVKYPNGAEYRGGLAKNKYQKGGLYVLENKLPLFCNFIDNQPRGNLVLVDMNGIFWSGKATGNSAILMPENVFFTNLNYSRGKGRPRVEVAGLEPPTKKEEEEEKEEEVELVQELLTDEEIIRRDRELEKQVFAKSTKTASKIDFTGSDWWRDYACFRAKKDRIVLFAKLMGEQILDDGDRKWYAKYMKFKKNLKTRMAKRAKMKEGGGADERDCELLEMFFSEEFKKSCPAIKTFYPTIAEENSIIDAENADAGGK